VATPKYVQKTELFYYIMANNTVEIVLPKITSATILQNVFKQSVRSFQKYCKI